MQAAELEQAVRKACSGARIAVGQCEYRVDLAAMVMVEADVDVAAASRMELRKANVSVFV